ncbi:DUF3368 domain-containing protein [Spirulina subsalsa]|uniref:DUF3368 domain-containing protein n=1 Tax=Spirulina subsalsa TaxID=54311 RepID=UPI0003671E9B|nr:DUF3368 domain-containing protein [Spirulina subsalsa]
MLVISDTSTITNLAAIQMLHLLKILYEEIIIPQAVYEEMVNLPYSVPGANELQNSSWIKAKSVLDKQPVMNLENELDRGEAEAIILALELNADLLLLDERKGRKVALKLGFDKITGLLGVLIEAKSQGLISQIQPIMDQLISEQNFRISEALYKQVLEISNE